MKFLISIILACYAAPPCLGKGFDDVSYLRISAFSAREKTTVYFVVTDPQGRRTGETPNGARYFNNVGSYGIEAASFRDGGSGPESVVFTGSEIMAGIYHVTFYAIQTSTFAITVLSDDSKGKDSSTDKDVFYDILPAGKTCEYKIDYNPYVEGKRTTFEKIVTFETLRQDLHSAKELKAIRSEEVFKRLLQRIDEIEKSGSPGESWKPVGERQKSLEVLVQEIQSQTKKIIHPQISAIIQQDINVLLNNLK